MKLPRVMLADDHTLLTEAFRKLLEPHYEVVGTVADGLALLAVAPSLNPHVVLVDIAMPLLGGLEAGRQLKQKMPQVKLIFLTMHEDPILAARAMRQGASGYLLKYSFASEVFHAIRAALKGTTYVTPRIARGIQEAFIRDPVGKQADKTLTRRQLEVLQLLAEGKSMKEAAAVLQVTPRTIAFHKYRIMEDFRIKTSADLVKFAIEKRVLVA